MERLTDDQLRWLATKALNDDVDHLASEFYNILTELQERREQVKELLTMIEDMYERWG